MNEHGTASGNTPEKHTFPDTSELLSQLEDGDEDYYRDYADWANEQAEAKIEPYPRQLELGEAAERRKSDLKDQLNTMLERLASEEVRGKGHYSPGGEAEVVTEMRKLQQEGLPKIYTDTRHESDFLTWHTTQETGDWCQLASLQNAFEALGDTSVTQASIAHELNVHPQSRPFPDSLMDFARSKGLDVKKVDSVTEMIDALAAGAKIILNTGYPAVPTPHAILVSGVRINYGDIEFLYNDPAMDEGAKTVPLARMLELLEPPLAHNALNRSYAVSRHHVDVTSD